MMTIRATGRVLVAIAVGACAGSDEAPGEAPLGGSITEAALRADVYALAHDSMGGRLVGTPDIERASDWIRDRFASPGLEPAGDDGTYDHRFDLVCFSLGEGNRLTVSGTTERQPGEGWYPLDFSATASATAAVVFAGFGMAEPRLGYDDYRGADIAGKIVLVLRSCAAIAFLHSRAASTVTTPSKALAGSPTPGSRSASPLRRVRDLGRGGTGSVARCVASHAPAALPTRADRSTAGAGSGVATDKAPKNSGSVTGRSRAPRRCVSDRDQRSSRSPIRSRLRSKKLIPWCSTNARRSALPGRKSKAAP